MYKPNSVSHKRDGSYLSDHTVADMLERSTLKCADARNGKLRIPKGIPSLFDLASGRVYPAFAISVPC